MTPIELRDALVRPVQKSRDTLLPAIRAELFFHLQHAEVSTRKYRVRNVIYPAWLFARLLRAREHPIAPHEANETGRPVAFVIQYAAPAGFGCLKPIIERLHQR